PPPTQLLPYTTLFRSQHPHAARLPPDDLIHVESAEFGHHDVGDHELKVRTVGAERVESLLAVDGGEDPVADLRQEQGLDACRAQDRKSTRLNSSHVAI